jgi:hypothetical protein
LKVHISGFVYKLLFVGLKYTTLKNDFLQQDLILLQFLLDQVKACPCVGPYSEHTHIHLPIFQVTRNSIDVFLIFEFVFNLIDQEV